VNDLTILDNGDGTFTLSWHYRNLGDYDQNGKVGISDITPLAMHYGESYEPTDANCLLAVIDGSGNGRIGIEDITPLAIHFAVDVHHYAIEGAAEEAGAYELVSEISQDAGIGEGRLAYSAIIESPSALWHRVVPYDSEGAPGEPSNAVLRPSNEPVIYEVSPTEGYQHEERTFSATVTGAEPLTYAWDFGGGAEPNQSSGVGGQPSARVTLADAGVYAASLTVTNAYGEASFPFTLTVSEREMWAHTWGAGGMDYPMGIAVDAEGMIYVIGYCPAFGAVLLKYDSGGNLLRARTWGGKSDRVGAADLSISADGSLYIVGSTENYGPGEVSSALITKFDSDCNLLWARAWGGPWRTIAGGIVASPDGGCYVAGRRSEVAYGLDNLFVLKLDSEGNLLKQKAWRPNGIVSVSAAGMATDGSFYIAGGLLNASMSNLDALLVKYDANLNFQWARQWGGEGDDRFRDLEILNDCRILVAGYTENYSPEQGNALLATFSPNGEPDEAWLYSTPLGDLAWRSLDVIGDRWCVGGRALTEYWGCLVVDILPDFTIRRTRLATGGIWVPYMASSQEEDVYMFTSIWQSSWAWSDGAEVSGTQIEGSVSEPQGETGDWDGTFVELDLKATTPEGRIDDYDPTSDSGDLALMKNFPDQG